MSNVVVGLAASAVVSPIYVALTNPISRLGETVSISWDIPCLHNQAECQGEKVLMVAPCLGCHRGDHADFCDQREVDQLARCVQRGSSGYARVRHARCIPWSGNWHLQSRCVANDVPRSPHFPYGVLHCEEPTTRLGTRGWRGRRVIIACNESQFLSHFCSR